MADDDEDSGPIIGSGNFLADRGYPDPEGLRDRILAANAIAVRAGDGGMSAEALAAATGLTPDEAAGVLELRVRDMSPDRLAAALAELDGAEARRPRAGRARVFETSEGHGPDGGHDASDELLPEHERVSEAERAAPTVRWLVEGPELGHEARRKRIGFRRTRTKPT